MLRCRHIEGQILQLRGESKVFSRRMVQQQRSSVGQLWGRMFYFKQPMVALRMRIARPFQSAAE
jgi:hypothetical protein